MGLTERHVNIMGAGYEGFMLFLAEILCCAGKKILLLDHTKEHTMKEYLPGVEGLDPEKHIVDYGGIGYAVLTGTEERETAKDSIKNADNYEVHFNLYDIKSIFDNGVLVSEEDKKADTTLLFIDEKAGNIAALLNTKPEPDSILVINDYTGAIKRRIENTAVKLGIEKVYVLPLNARDRKLEILAGYNDRFKFRGLSRERKEVLMELSGLIIPGISKRELGMAYNTAARGGRK